MDCLFLTRGNLPALSAVVSITGSGSPSYCYTTIAGTKYQTATNNISVHTGDEIIFGIYGTSKTYYGEVTIDGTQVLKVTDKTTRTYAWTVPKGVKQITIAMTYTSNSKQRNGRISVTTSK